MLMKNCVIHSVLWINSRPICNTLVGWRARASSHQTTRTGPDWLSPISFSPVSKTFILYLFFFIHYDDKELEKTGDKTKTKKIQNHNCNVSWTRTWSVSIYFLEWTRWMTANAQERERAQSHAWKQEDTPRWNKRMNEKVFKRNKNCESNTNK